MITVRDRKERFRLTVRNRFNFNRLFSFALLFIAMHLFGSTSNSCSASEPSGLAGFATLSCNALWRTSKHPPGSIFHPITESTQDQDGDDEDGQGEDGDDEEQPEIKKTPQERQLETALAILKRHGVTPDFASMSEYLAALQPNHPTRKKQVEEVRELIKQLGSEQFELRQRAQTKLTRMIQLPTEQIQKAAKSKDPEIVWRVNEIIRRNSKPKRADSLPGIVEAIGVVIKQNRQTGLTKQLFDTVPLLANETITDRNALNAIREAIQVTTGSDDVLLMREQLRAKNFEQQAIAISAIPFLVGTDAIKDLIPLLDDESEAIQVRTARELANMGHRGVMPKLVELMGSDEINSRIEANRILRAATGQKFEFMAYAKPEKRKESVERWNSWVSTHGPTAEFVFPLPDVSIELGRFLISDYSGNKVTEYDIDGAVLWEVDVDHPWGVQGLPNGHRVVASYQPAAVIEYDAVGEEVWRLDDVPGNAMGLHRLDNGNTLVACSSTNKVIEYSKEKEIVWEATLESRVCDVQRLENGNTLVALIAGKKVVEVNEDGEVVWEVAVEGSPLTAERNDDGTTLVSCNDKGVAIEYDKDGKELRRFEMSPKCTAARMLSNGSLFICNGTTAKLISPDGTELWSVTGAAMCYGANNF